MKEITSTEQLIHWFIYLLPYAMAVVFVLGASLRGLVYLTVRRHEWFSREFETRVNRYVDAEVPGKISNVSFYVLAKRMLERTYYEAFEARDRDSSKKPDRVMRLSDRIFLVKQGCAWLVKDILKQLKFLKWTNETPKLLQITKATFHHNPCFNRVFGIIPVGGLNDILNILPGLFVVAGILGTFLGIKGGLTALGGMNLSDLETTKNVMDSFLHEIAYAMASSIVGIAFSLALHLWNTSFSPERAYVSMIDRFESALDLLWYRSDNNDYPMSERAFDEHRDPVDALAEEALSIEISKNQRSRDMDTLRKVKTS
ncbi:MAG: hypothetical protein AB7N80_07075 [Bdellovibrionales bacterium]